MAEQSCSDEPYRRLILLLVGVVFLWMTYLIAMLAITDRWETRSQFGEAFGAIEALFSGLAFAGLIYTIALQRKELQLQRKELRLTRKELRRTATAQEQAEASLRQQSETMLLTARLTVMTSLIELKRARQTMLGAPSNIDVDQISGFISELEAVLASIPPKPHQWEGVPNGPDR
jgi:hypothetical protein